MNRIYALILASLTATSASATLLPGVYDGTNDAAWFKKKCVLRVEEGSNNSIVVVSASDSANVYNIWMADDKSNHDLMGPDTWTSSGSIGYSMRDAAGTKIYSTSSNTADSGIYSLYVITNEKGEALSYQLKHHDVTTNEIQCEGLKIRE